MHFAHGAGLDGDEGGGEAAGDGEGFRVEDLDGAAGDAVGLVNCQRIELWGGIVSAYRLLGPVEAVGVLLGYQPRGTGLVLLLNVRWRGGAREDPQLVRGGFFEGVEGSAEVLRDDALGHAVDEPGDEEGVLLAEGSVVEDFRVLALCMYPYYSGK